MKDIVALFSIFFCFYHAFGQVQFEVEGTHTPDTVAKIMSTYEGQEDVVGLYVKSKPAINLGVAGYFHGGNIGLKGYSALGTGVQGESSHGQGVYGESTYANGIYGYSARLNGVKGQCLVGDCSGVSGFAPDGNGVLGISTIGYGIRGESVESSGVYGYGISGVYGKSSAYGAGVRGESMGTGVFGRSYSGIGVIGSSVPEGVVIYIDDVKVGVMGTSDSVGVLGFATGYDAVGVLGRTGNYTHTRALKGEALGINSIGVMGVAQGDNSTAVWGDGYTGGYFRGTGGVSIRLGGSNSDYSNDTNEDDSVIKTQDNKIHGDMFLASNDAIALHLDDDNNSSGSFEIFNGTNNRILYLNESGDLTIAGSCNCISSFTSSANDQSILEERIATLVEENEELRTMLEDVLVRLSKLESSK